ncbi:MAG: hypothetical protein R3B09_01645 [Nannocystaceae bacterium]
MEITQNRSTLSDHAAECYERYKAAFLQTRAGAELPAWKDLDPDVRGRWVAAIRPLHEAATERDALRDDHEELLRRLRTLADADERASSRLRALEAAVAAARGSLPDMIAVTPLPGPFAEVITRLQRALDTAAGSETESGLAT